MKDYLSQKLVPTPSYFSNKALFLLLALGFSGTACQDNHRQVYSQPDVSDVKHSTVKRQSIGNCWLYAHASWLESLYLSHHDEIINVSESYWTWWHWYDQLVGSSQAEISTGGSWWTSSSIIQQHGYVLEGEFIPDESELEMSQAQSRAERIINQELVTGGRLDTPEKRTAEAVRSLLDEAFDSDMQAAELLARKSSEVMITQSKDGREVSLQQALESYGQDGWKYVSFPSLWGKDAVVDSYTKKARQNLMKRVYRAVNDYYPVVISTMIDFNAMDRTDAAFKRSTLDQAGQPGSQGGHMMVLEDYVVDGVPGIGRIEEGDVSAELKEQAIEGDLVYLVTKNSWGTNRPDRGLTDGYTRFYQDYLFGQLEWTYGEGDEQSSSYYTTLSGFVLPPGY